MDTVFIRSEIELFENLIEAALQEKYATYPEQIKTSLLRNHPMRTWNVITFFEAFHESKCYPIERLNRSIYYLFDIKLQMYLIIEVDIGLYNRLVYDRGYNQNNPHAKPHIFITRLSLDQSLISKSRILWERIMNFVFFLETGEILDDKVPRKKSKKSFFFAEIIKYPNWKFLEPYYVELQKYDDSFRTPEFHKSSILRKELLGRRDTDPDDLMNLINRAINVIWENALSITKGNQPTHFTDLHCTESGSLDKRFL